MTPEDLRQRLISERISKGVSQTEMAQAAGISQSSVAHFESGRNYLSSDTIDKMAAHLGFRLVLEMVEPEQADVYRFVELVRGVGAADMSRLERIATAMRRLDDPTMKDVLVAAMESSAGIRPPAKNPFR